MSDGFFWQSVVVLVGVLHPVESEARVEFIIMGKMTQPYLSLSIPLHTPYSLHTTLYHTLYTRYDSDCYSTILLFYSMLLVYSLWTTLDNYSGPVLTFPMHCSPTR